MAETLADYRDRGILRRMRITPLRPWQILGAHAATHLAMTASGTVLLIGVGAVAYDLSAPASVPATALALFASSVSLIALGFLLGALLPSVRTTQAVAGAIYFPAIFVSGAVFPREGLTASLPPHGLRPRTPAVGHSEDCRASDRATSIWQQLDAYGDRLQRPLDDSVRGAPVETRDLARVALLVTWTVSPWARTSRRPRGAGCTHRGRAEACVVIATRSTRAERPTPGRGGRRQPHG